MLKFLVFSAGYNGGEWIQKHMESVAEQSYPNLLHIVVDDASTDDSWEMIEKHKHDRCVVIRNKKNMGWIHNAVTYIPRYISNGEDVICGLDLDDWIAHDGVMSYIANVYRERDCWMTYGSLIRDSGEVREANCEGWPKDVVQKCSYRAHHVWRFWAMRTFKAFMWLALDKRRLLDPSGREYSKFTYDWAVGFPLLEMCPPKKLYHVKEFIYVYNVSNPLNDKKVNRARQYELGQHFKRQSPVPDYVMEGQRRMQRFVVFSCGRDCAEFVEKHIKSIKGQTYQNFFHVIVDDASKDESVVEQVRIWHDPERTKLIRNKQNKGWIGNAVSYLDQYIESDEDVVVVVDLDDWLADPWVLERLNTAYNRKQCWLTYGTWAVPDDPRIASKYRDKWGKETPKPRQKEAGEVVENRTFRTSAAFSHLKTFKAFLWRNIDREDLKGPDGEWPPCCYDRAIMYPMLEMCPTDKIYRMRDLLYIYNIANPFCHAWDEKRRKRQIVYENYFKSKKPYEILKRK
jgi:glycosyltransferase involved in cell wall biosynthesis